MCGAGHGTRHSRRWPGRLSSEGTTRQGPGEEDLVFGKGKKKVKSADTKKVVKRVLFVCFQLNFYYHFSVDMGATCRL